MGRDEANEGRPLSNPKSYLVNEQAPFLDLKEDVLNSESFRRKTQAFFGASVDATPAALSSPLDSSAVVSNPKSPEISPRAAGEVSHGARVSAESVLSSSRSSHVDEAAFETTSTSPSSIVSKPTIVSAFNPSFFGPRDGEGGPVFDAGHTSYLATQVDGPARVSAFGAGDVDINRSAAEVRELSNPL
jgi:hypothetical protein